MLVRQRRHEVAPRLQLNRYAVAAVYLARTHATECRRITNAPRSPPRSPLLSYTVGKPFRAMTCRINRTARSVRRLSGAADGYDYWYVERRTHI